MHVYILQEGSYPSLIRTYNSRMEPQSFVSAVVFLHACPAHGSASPTDISSTGLRLRRDSLQVALGAMARAKNTASEEDLRKCLKGELDSLDPAKFNADTEDVVEAYCIFIRSLLRLTPRPNVSVLAKAAQKVFLKADPDTCKKWSQSICNAIQHCRKKLKSMKSGTKLSPAVKSICDAIKKGQADVESCSLRSTPRTSAIAGLLLHGTPQRVTRKRSASTSRSRVLKPNFSVSSSEPTPIKKARSTVLQTPAIGAGTARACSSKDVVAISDSCEAQGRLGVAGQGGDEEKISRWCDSGKRGGGT